MKIGDYVRTKDGKIFKWSKLCTIDKEYVEEHTRAIYFDKNEIKSSPDIRDLIEYGDIIKYKIDDEEFISEVWGEKNNYFVQNFDVPIDLKDLNIISIVTKEQFKEMEYEVK